MKAVGQLNHPHIVPAYDAREIDGLRLLVMEYVDGIDLASLVDRNGPLPVAEACELVRQAAEGLQYVHENGLVHRDIKPSNLMLTVGGQPTTTGLSGGQSQSAIANRQSAIIKILDLGLARLEMDPVPGEEITTTGQAMGTADYIAPEQVEDTHSVDIRADIYSLGCTLYKLLAGQPPFAGPDYPGPIQKFWAHANKPVPPIAQFREDIPPRLAVVLERMLAKAPADRYATPAEVAAAIAPFGAESDLDNLVNGATSKAREDTAEAASRTVAQAASGLPVIETRRVRRAGKPSVFERIRKLDRRALAVAATLTLRGRAFTARALDTRSRLPRCLDRTDSASRWCSSR
jgi:serine/threonine protein kinase